MVFLRLMCLDEVFGISLENSVVMQNCREPFNVMRNSPIEVEEIMY